MLEFVLTQVPRYCKRGCVENKYRNWNVKGLWGWIGNLTKLFWGIKLGNGDIMQEEAHQLGRRASRVDETHHRCRGKGGSRRGARRWQSWCTSRSRSSSGSWWEPYQWCCWCSSHTAAVTCWRAPVWGGCVPESGRVRRGWRGGARWESRRESRVEVLPEQVGWRCGWGGGRGPVSNRGGPWGLVGRQRADTTLHCLVSLVRQFSSELESIGKVLPEEGRTSLECAGLLAGLGYWVGR